MSKNLNIELSELQKELYDLSARNPLIHSRIDKLYFEESPVLEKLIKIYQKSLWFQKEYGLETTLAISHFIQWKVPGQEHYYLSPLLYKTCKIIKKRKIEDEYTIEKEEFFQINPILEHYFSEHFDVTFNEINDISLFIHQLCESFATQSEKIELTQAFDNQETWMIIEKAAIGNFNYKKAALSKDYAEIKLRPSNSIRALLGNVPEFEPPSIESSPTIVSLDASQNEALKAAKKNHLVIQGPPGTGKSHTIVGLIGGFLQERKKILFISEKKSALNVVHERLKKLGLESITSFVDSGQDSKKSFYNGLRKTWKKISEFDPSEKTKESVISNEFLNYFGLEYTRIRPELGISIHALIEQLLQNPPQKKLEIKGTIPDYKTWSKHVEFLTFLEKRVVQEFQKSYLTECTFAHLNKSAFLDKDPILTLEKRLYRLQQLLQDIVDIQVHLKLTIGLKDFTQLCVSASVMAMVDNVQIDLLVHGTKAYNSFNSSIKKYELVKSKLNQVISANKKWKNKPSLSEVIELIDLIKNKRQSKGIFSLLRRQRLLNEKFASFSPHLSDDAKITLLESLRLEWRLQGELKEIEIKLDHNLGISEPERDIPLIKDLRRKLDKVAPNDYMFLLEQENHLSVIRDLAAFHPKIQELQTLLRFVFEIENAPEIIELNERTIATLNDLPELTKWMEEVGTFFKLPFEIRSFIIQNKGSILELTAKVNEYSLLRETRFENSFKDLNGETLLKALKNQQNQVLQQQAFRCQENIGYAANSWKKKEKLLVTPASKLKEKEKELKKNLRLSKKILFNELSKKQRFLPVHTFYEQTELWLNDIFSVWLMNPLSVSEQLPLQKEIFDVVIFDEASQIPLEDAIPALFRAKQIIVVGDEHQMPPSTFFSSKEQPKTLLQQAQLVFKNVMLKWHYRSEHPALIQFSNRLFYENELITFPPLSDANPIEFVKVEGEFNKGENEIEADALVAKISLLNCEKSKIGVIAFSMQQANLIQKKILKSIPNGEEIMVRNLENVQGVERDYIFVSIGYGFDKEDEFRMNFGPINQESGLNRLNVLVTRAKTKLTIVTSVSARDFKMSDNPGVQTLQDFLNYAEHGYTLTSLGMKTGIAIKKTQEIINEHSFEVHFYNTTLQIGFNAFIQHKTGKVLLVDPTLDEAEIKDLNTIFSVIQERFSKAMIVLSTDFMNNPIKTKDNIVNFFR